MVLCSNHWSLSNAKPSLISPQDLTVGHHNLGVLSPLFTVDFLSSSNFNENDISHSAALRTVELWIDMSTWTTSSYYNCDVGRVKMLSSSYGNNCVYSCNGNFIHHSQLPASTSVELTTRDGFTFLLSASYHLDRPWKKLFQCKKVNKNEKRKRKRRVVWRLRINPGIRPIRISTQIFTGLWSMVPVTHTSVSLLEIKFILVGAGVGLRSLSGAFE